MCNADPIRRYHLASEKWTSLYKTLIRQILLSLRNPDKAPKQVFFRGDNRLLFMKVQNERLLSFFTPPLKAEEKRKALIDQ